MRQTLRKRKPCLTMRVVFLALCALIFSVPAMAQNVYMHSGTQNVSGSLNFYDSGGPSSVSGSYYWEKWYQHNENSTITFKNGDSPIQVSFNLFHAWDDDAEGTGVVDLGQFSLRVNNDHLYVYDGESADASKLICDLTGTLEEPFTLTTNGPITFKFVSDGQYRDEGWYATVTSPNTYTVQKPIITKDVCSDYVILYNTANDGQVYYTTDGNDPDENDPLTNSTLYSNPFAIDLDATNASVIVKARVVTDDQASAVASHTFTHSDQRPTPGAPQIIISGNTVKFVPEEVPAGLNETYNIRYTTDGTDPTATSGTLLTKNTGFSIEWHTPNTTFKAVTVAVTCSSKVSEVTTAQFGNVTVPTPTITFDGDGKAHIICALDGATIYYTTDGTQPTASHYTDMGTTPVTTMALPIGTTVYAYAVFNAQGGGYTDSAIGSATYVPAGGNGTYGGVVFLDDREDHTWSYYSDDEQPIHSLKPIDVKITYNGFGDNTMTSTNTQANGIANSAFNANVNSSQVAVNVGEPGNQFIYLKTLEATNADGSGDYPYTMIANPFQVRPLYNPSRGDDNANAISYNPQSINDEVRDRNGNIVAYTAGTSGTMTPTASIAKQGGVNRGNRDISVDVVSGGTQYNTYVPMYTSYCDYGFVSQYLIPASYFTNAGISVGDQLTSITLYQGNNTGAWVAKNLGIWMGSTTSTSFTSNAFLDEGDDDTNVYWNESYTSNSASSHTFTFSTPFVFTGNNVYVWIQAASGGTYVYSNWRGISSNNMSYYIYYNYYGNAQQGSRQSFIPNTTFTVAPSGPRTVTAVAGTNISTAYVAEGSTFPAGTTTTTLQVESGNSVTFQATPNSNFAFGGWYDENNNLVSTNATYTCTVTRDLTLTAKGLPTYTVNAVAGENINTAYVAAGSNFSGTETSVTVAEGGSATFQATVNSGYLFAGWYDEQGMKVSSNTTYTVENITGNFTLTAKAKVPHTVTIASTSNGTVTANPTTAGEGSTISLTVTPNSGYAISSITVTGNTTNNTYVVSGQGTSYTFTMPDENVTVSAVFFQKTAASYRGFYAWRVKNMSSGLSIKVGNNTYTSANIANGIILYPDQEIQFAAEGNSTGNEVEFEALWARAWVNSTSSSERATNSGNYKNAYERNFKVGTSITTYSYPVTLSTLNPDGSGTLGSVSYNNNYSCSSDVKFENMTLNLNNNYLNGNNHSLHIGRGVSRGNNNVASSVYGYYNPSGDINGFTLRIESGRYTNAYLFYYSSYRQISSSTTWNMILGSDYDRANEDNSKLTIAGPAEVSYRVSSSSTSAKISVTGLSGTFGTTAANTELYLGYESRADDNSAQTPRTLQVYGGEYLGGIAGGIEDDVTATTEVLKMRIYGGTVHQKVYGAGQYSAAVGTRRTIITGGTYDCWIAGGCYGTEDSGGATNGDVYVYFGGDANQTNTGGIYGAGYGTAATSNNSYTVNKSFVVVADDASAAGSVYGGGNNGYCTGDTEVWVLGGGEEKLTVSGSVYGGANLSRSGGANTVTMKGGTVNGSVYGGAQGATATTDIVYVTNLATVNIKGGNVKNNVFGGGLGASTVMRGGTNVTVSGGTVKNNVYGGGEQGTVGRSATYPANTSVTIKGGSVNDVYGAGMGTSSQRANITGSTTVSIEDGTVNGSVYGGGQNGTVAYAANGANNTNYNSTVGVSGGEVKGNVYGGGKKGTSQVATFVNISDGIIRGHVFGGAEGEQKSVFVTGLRTVNMTGGHVYGNVYGGSQNANDGNNTTLADNTFSGSNTTTTMCVTNISAGVVDENVYAAGYFGNCFGSVYVFIGKDAIENAPYKQPTSNINYKVATLSIAGTVWAGGDWGTFSGEFGNSTISGNSNIYVDGEGYETTTHQVSNAQYMNIGGSILGCGTSCHAGKAERTVIIRNYGTVQGAQPTEASRTLFSIQFAKVLIIDNSNINFTGQGRVNNLSQTEKYSMYEIYNNAKDTNLDTDVDGVRIVNGTGIFLNAPITQIANFRSMSCTNTFASTTPTLNGYTVITPSTLSSCNNQVRVNGGNYIEIKWGDLYGALIGYSHMMASNDNEDGTCAYARPRWETNASFAQNSGTDNPNDGGWISYTASENTFALDGTAGDVQMPYENHTIAKNGEQYFRIWRIGGMEHYREGIFDAHATGTDDWVTVDVVITLPAFRDPANYYCFEANGDATTIDYGADVLMWNAARENGTGNDWMYYDEDNDTQMSGQAQSAVNTTLTEMKKNADVNFGLVIMPETGMSGGDYIICYEADNNLADTVNTIYTKSDNTKEPQIRFRLTYYNKLSSNMTWDPSTIVLVQKDANGKTVDRVTISLAVSTSSTIEQEFTTQLYAIMQGKGSTAETFNAKVVLPTFSSNLYTPGVAATFTLNSVTFEPANGGNLVARGGTYNLNNYAVGYAAGLNYDNTDGWNGEGNYTERDSYPLTQNNPTATVVGKTGGRTEFAIDFTLHYDGSQTVTTEELIGTLTFNITFDNYKDANGNLVTNQPLTIIVEVWRRGQGTRFYIDGINGSNANDAKHPDKAVKQLSTIFNRCGYMAGDEIYIVNQVTANKQLNWNGLPYSNVTIYRYNGGHELSAVDASIVGNPNNTAYLGNLLNVKNRMTMTGITLDGYYNNGETTYTGPDPETGEDTELTLDPNGGPHTVTATASMITIADGGTLELSLGTVLYNNNSSSINGSAVNVADGGKLMMNQDATIKNNVTTGDGGGVYMAGTLVVSDNIKIIDNMKGDVQNNVFLTAKEKMITIGTASGSDAYGELGDDARIGVTKKLFADIDNAYTRVVNVDQEVDKEWLERPYNTHPNSIIYHDLGKYQLVKYSDPKILYWIGTWVTFQDHVPTQDEGGWDWDGESDDIYINTQYQYAWVISVVNGENGEDGNSLSGKTVHIMADLDMDESIWVPIGNDAHPFMGTINGNGHLIENMHSPLVQDNMGMIGIANGATIQDAMALVDFKANSVNIGSVVGTMTSSTITNVEAGGVIKGGENTVNLGGLAGNVVSGTIHSSFAVNDTLVGVSATVMGGLVGTNGGNLYNSYANTYMTGSSQMGGLVGENKANCHVENCYVNLGQMEIPAFAYTNMGDIDYCYASKAGQYVSSEVENNRAPQKSGIFSATKDRKDIDYMYRDNIVTAASDNAYASHESIEYTDGTHAPLTWNGLLSVLNEWVDKTLVEGDFSHWYRPTTQALNNDLPVLAFPKDNCMGNFAEEEGKFLRYSASDEITTNNNVYIQANNGLDHLFEYYRGKAANIFLYKNTVNVVNGSVNANLFINEETVLLQKATNDGYSEINATVGITFDNSCKMATDYWSDTLTYDWHLMSTPLANAPLGITYGNTTTDYNYWVTGDKGQAVSVFNSYMPNMQRDSMNADWARSWDFYTYYEPQYHWINFKRNIKSHHHFEDPHENIPYEEFEQTTNAEQGNLIPGRGYMMAIDLDSYLSNTGRLNSGNVPIPLTVSGQLPETVLPSKDWGSNLVGNPYQAYLNLDSVAAGNSGINNFYVYDAENGTYGPYITGASINPAIPSKFIHPHQAFFVVTDSTKVVANDNFKFTYNMATLTKNETSYFRDEEQPRYPVVNLFAQNEAGNRDMAVIELNRPELGGVRKVNNLRNANFKISAHLGGHRYGLLFTPEGTEKIPVHFQASEDGIYTLTWSMYNGNFTSLRLIDNKTGVNYDMLTNNSYTFEASADDYASRFYITYTVTDVNENVTDGDNSFAYFNGSEWVISGKGHLDVIDLTGRVLYAAQLNNEENRVHLDGVAKGVYLLRVIDNKVVRTQKIIVR